MEAIGYFEAWAMWFGGQEVDGQLLLWGLPVLWWSRVGKIVSFVGGATVVLDLIGADRLRNFGRRARQARSDSDELADGSFIGALVDSGLGLRTMVITFCGIIGAVVFRGGDSGVSPSLAITLSAGVPLLLMLAGDFGPPLVVRLLDTDKPAEIVRYVGAIMLLVGFHFDLLAS